MSSKDKKKEKGIQLIVAGKKRFFDITDDKLPDWIEDKALASGNYPYNKKMPKSEYQKTIIALQAELIKLQTWMQKTGERVISLFEGRDAAGKGGSIARIREYMNPRSARNVALAKPNDQEKGQLYFQRYITHFPTSGEFITFDRSWYNRAGVESVMGFATPEQVEGFLTTTPTLESILVSSNIRFFKFWLDIGQEMQLKRFHQRVHNPLKYWKYSDMDEIGMQKWDEYTNAIKKMIERTHTAVAPWTIIRANDKRRARIAVIRHILLSIPYEGRDLEIIGIEDDKIVGSGPNFLQRNTEE